MSASTKRSIISELRQRNVFRVAIAYVIVAWLLIQVVDVLVPMLGLPEWVGRLVFLLLVVGFPLALLFAWAFDLTPEGLQRTPSEPGAEVASTAPRTRGRAVFVAFLLVTVAVAAWLQFFAPTPAARSNFDSASQGTNNAITTADLLHLELNFPDDAPLALIGAAELGNGKQAFSISPNGRYLAYVGSNNGAYELYLRDLFEDTTTRLSGTTGAFHPFFAPNNAWIGFFIGNDLYKVHISGSEPVLIAEATNSVGATWTSGDEIVFAIEEGQKLVKVSASGGTVSEVPSTYRLRFPFAIRGLDSVIVGGRLVDLSTGEDRALPNSVGADTRYANGYLFYESSGSLYAARFDAARNELRSNPIPVISGLRSEIWGAAQWSVSDQGVLVYMPGGPAGANPMYWVGAGEPVALDLPIRTRGTMEVSPNGKYLAVSELAGPNRDVWTYDLANGRSYKLTTNGLSGGPIFWSPDSSTVYYRKGSRETVASYRRLLNSQQPAEQVIQSDPIGLIATSISADGRLLGLSGTKGVAVFELDTGRLNPVSTESKSDWGTAISPDGRAIVYTSSVTGAYHNFLQPYPPTGKRYQISRDGGAEEPRWSADGSKIYFRSGTRIMVVDVELDPEIQIGEPRVFYSGMFENVGGRSYAIHPDGERALVIRSENLASSIRVVSNWFAKVERLIQESEARSR